jgi:hypothetical protein
LSGKLRVGIADWNMVANQGSTDFDAVRAGLSIWTRLRELFEACQRQGIELREVEAEWLALEDRERGRQAEPPSEPAYISAVVKETVGEFVGDGSFPYDKTEEAKKNTKIFRREIIEANKPVESTLIGHNESKKNNYTSSEGKNFSDIKPFVPNLEQIEEAFIARIASKTGAPLDLARAAFRMLKATPAADDQCAAIGQEGVQSILAAVIANPQGMAAVAKEVLHRSGSGEASPVQAPEDAPAELPVQSTKERLAAAVKLITGELPPLFVRKRARRKPGKPSAAAEARRIAGQYERDNGKVTYDDKAMPFVQAAWVVLAHKRPKSQRPRAATQASKSSDDIRL